MSAHFRRLSQRPSTEELEQRNILKRTSTNAPPPLLDCVRHVISYLGRINMYATSFQMQSQTPSQTHVIGTLNLLKN